MSAAFVEISIDPVQITGVVTEYAGAVTALTAVVRAYLFGIFLQHHPSHRGVVYVAQRRELLPGRHEGLLIVSRCPDTNAGMGVSAGLP